MSVLDANPDKVNNYKLGKTALIGLFVGEIMKQCKGDAEPKEVMEILLSLLKKIEIT